MQQVTLFQSDCVIIARVNLLVVQRLITFVCVCLCYYVEGIYLRLMTDTPGGGMPLFWRAPVSQFEIKTQRANELRRTVMERVLCSFLIYNSIKLSLPIAAAGVYI